jgi:ketosteroid isomerase-like protein
MTPTQTQESRLQATAAERQEILAVIEALHEAHYRKDADAVVAQYSHDAVIYNLAPPLVHHGVDRAEKQQWFDSWATPVEIDSQGMEISVSGDFALCHGFLRLTGTKKGAEGSVQFWMRETLCLERKMEGWRIVHEHSSVPFYMDGSLRPAFDLHP